jgi:DNA-binding LacI/PurR family transcriptional regulator
MNGKVASSKSRRATIVDVAEAAGVSRQTVTRAMNDMPGISDSTRARVLSVAASLKYRPSRFGRGLVKQGIPTLGLVINDLTNPYYAELAAGVLGFAAQHGWTMLVTESFRDVASAERGMQQLATQVDAVIGYLEPFGDHIERIFGDMPLVSLEPWNSDLDRATVSIDFDAGMADAIGRLLAVGKRRIWMIDSSPSGEKSDRAQSYEKLARAHGLEPRVHLSAMGTGGDLHAGLVAARAVVESDSDVDGIVAFNDMMAIGAMRYLRTAGFVVPDDCAVIGIDGIPIGSMIVPELTTLSLDIRAMAHVAVEMIVKMANGELPLGGPATQRSVAHTLTIRASA